MVKVQTSDTTMQGAARLLFTHEPLQTYDASVYVVMCFIIAYEFITLGISSSGTSTGYLHNSAGT